MLLADLLLDKIRDQLSRYFASFLSREKILERHPTKHILNFHIASDRVSFTVKLLRGRMSLLGDNVW